MKRTFSHLHQNEAGFTLIEILMALLLISILSAVGISAFVNYSKDAKNAATKSNLQVLRNGINTQFANLTLHCNDITSTWPALATLQNNNITQPNTDGAFTGSCTTTDVTNANDRQFVGGQGGLPVNPWGLGVTVAAGGAGNNLYDCTASGGAGTNKGANIQLVAGAPWTATVGGPTGSCNPTAGKDCSTAGANALYSAEATTAGAAAAAIEDGWCYDPTSGRMWANSQNNGGGLTAGENTF